ncbi:MAG: 2-phospho-L-lactate guanylyltransferase [Spirochaetia bacterium]|nr:2-phospho-L-lactate guanylyltransferase [Spirochaetia bacterium]
MHRTICIIPMKEPTLAKTRLSLALDSTERSMIAIKLFRNTISNLLKSTLDIDIIVVTGSMLVREICMEFSLPYITEPPDSDLNKILEESCTWATDKNYKQVIIIPSDLANPNFSLLAKYLYKEADTSDQNKLTIFPSYDGGTNCLITSLPILYSLQYGKGSALKHIEIAKSHGYHTELIDTEAFRLDIDTIEDLQLMEK